VFFPAAYGAPTSPPPVFVPESVHRPAIAPKFEQNEKLFDRKIAIPTRHASTNYLTN
jgi:hypothetical protein